MDIEKVHESIDLLIEKTRNKNIFWQKVDNSAIRVFKLTFPDKSEVRISKVIRHTSTSVVNIQFYNANFDIIYTDNAQYNNNSDKIVQLFDAIETQYFKKDETINSMLENLKTV